MDQSMIVTDPPNATMGQCKPATEVESNIVTLDKVHARLINQESKNILSTNPNTRVLAVNTLKTLYDKDETSMYHCAKICCILAFFGGELVKQARWAQQCLDFCEEIIKVEQPEKGTIFRRVIDDLVDCASEAKKHADLTNAEQRAKTREFWARYFVHNEIEAGNEITKVDVDPDTDGDYDLVDSKDDEPTSRVSQEPDKTTADPGSSSPDSMATVTASYISSSPVEKVVFKPWPRCPTAVFVEDPKTIKYSIYAEDGYMISRLVEALVKKPDSVRAGIAGLLEAHAADLDNDLLGNEESRIRRFRGLDIRVARKENQGKTA